MAAFRALAVFSLGVSSNAVEQRATANPIRKVVTLLQQMQQKVSAEGEREKALFDKYMCYCKDSSGSLQNSISDAEGKISDLPHKITSVTELKHNLEVALEKAKEMREEAKNAIATADALRKKEAAGYATASAEVKGSLAAIEKAIAALEKGLGGSFLQTAAAQVLRRVVVSLDMSDADRQDVTAFLTDSHGATEVVSSGWTGEIVGILKQMAETMAGGLAEETAQEKQSIAAHKDAVSAKRKEIKAITEAIERYTPRIGEMGVALVEMRAELSDTEAEMLANQQLAAELKKGCATKEEEWAVIVRGRAAELQALAETIKVLNDDDALELFKKTLPGASSFLQVQVTSEDLRARALSALRGHGHRFDLKFISLALRGRKIGFEKVVQMIDSLVETLKQEAQADLEKKEYCAAAFDKNEDQLKSLHRTLGNLDADIVDAKESIETIHADLNGLEEGIKALDASVAEATTQRKDENADYTTLMASDAAAKELLKFAKNRLLKFYNPKLYRPPPKRTLSEEDRITVNMGGTLAPTAAPGGIAGTGISALQIGQHSQRVPAAPAAPSAFKAKAEESNGVIAMIDLLIGDLDKELTQAQVDEKNAQQDYESFMADAAAKRALDTKSIVAKNAERADANALLQQKQASKSDTEKEQMAADKVKSDLHAECDWLLKFFDMRAEARTGEIEALHNAKAVLSGADYSLMQIQRVRFLRK